MSNIRPPEYGVKKDELTLTSQDPAAVLYGVTPDNKWIPINVDDSGNIMIGSTITLNPGDMEIGAVEVKNSTTDDRLTVTAAGEALTQARLYDAAGTGLTSSLVGAKQALDINVVGGTTISASEAEDNAVPAGMNLATVITLGYGYDGVDWERLNSTSGRLHVDGSGVTQPISAAALPLPTGASTEATLAAVKTQTDKLTFAATRLLVDGSGTTQPISAASLPLPTGAATEATLAAVKTDLDQFTFATGSVNSNITNTSLAVTQSGTWTVARSWTLSSGSDSVSAVQSGTWNINNISGTISLPTGASTEATLAAVKAQTDKLTFSATRLLVDGSGVTQPVSGTITANIGTTGGLALDATLTSGSQKTKIVDSTGANTLSIDSNGAAAIQSGGATGAAVPARAIQVGGSDGTNLRALKVSSTGVLSVDGSATTQPISAVSLPLPTGAATEATLATRLADATFTGRINTQGQKTMAASTPVVIASDQSSIPVVGNVASGAADSGNPVKVAGKYNASGVTLTDGQRGDIQLSSRGHVKVTSTYGGFDNLFWNDAGVAISASVTHDTVVPNGVIWDIESVAFGGSDLFNTNKTAGNVQVIWDAAGTPKNLAHVYTLVTDDHPIHYRVIGDGVKILRVISTNGANKVSDLSTRIIYSIG